MLQNLAVLIFFSKIGLLQVIEVVLINKPCKQPERFGKVLCSFPVDLHSM